jgi:hypothetical protein
LTLVELMDASGLGPEATDSQGEVVEWSETPSIIASAAVRWGSKSFRPLKEVEGTAFDGAEPLEATRIAPSRIYRAEP